jgi:DNA-binding GntR family transcriptional regulator
MKNYIGAHAPNKSIRELIIDGQDYEEQRTNRADSAGTSPRRHYGIHEQTRNQIREMIVSGVLVAGERIDEKLLSEQIGVSKTPIREALKVLAAEGLVDLQANRGSRVVKPSPEAIRNLFAVIASLERLAADTVAARANQGEVAHLLDLHDQMMVFFNTRNREKYFDLNHQIHETIIELTKNPELQRTHADLMTRARRPRFIAITSDRRWTESIKEHSLLMAAIELQDARTAGEILFRHVLKTGETYLEFFE